MTKVNPNNGNQTKSDIFPWDMFKSNTISFFIKKKLKYFKMTSRIKISQFCN